MAKNSSPHSTENKSPSSGRAGLVVMAVGIVILLISLASFLRPAGTKGINPPTLNSPMSNFELYDLQGRLIRLSDYREYVILINTWATWCPPCRAEMPDLNAFYQQYANEKFIILAINAGEAPSLAADFAREYELDFPILVDLDYRVIDALKIQSYPTSIVVDRDGVIRKIRVGVYTPETLAKEVLPLILN